MRDEAQANRARTGAILICMAALTACGGASTAPAVPPTPPEPPPALPSRVDPGELDADERAILAEILHEQLDPCGAPRTFFASLEAEDSCPEATRLAATLVERIWQGWSKRQTLEILDEERARLIRRYSFDLDGVPCFGTPAPGQAVIVKFSDYQCPHCATAFAPLKALAESRGALLCAKHLPLAFHRHARDAAHAAMAAHQQGRFWEYSEALFAQQASLGPDSFEAIARDLGLDLARFNADRASEAIHAHVARDRAESEAAEVDGTPALFVNGRRVPYGEIEGAL